jgi:hypothetical protein
MKYKMIPNPATTWKCTDRSHSIKDIIVFHGITGVITITFIKIISYGKYVIVARKYDDASFVWLALNVMC